MSLIGQGQFSVDRAAFSDAFQTWLPMAIDIYRVYAGQGFDFPEDQEWINQPTGTQGGMVMGFPRSAEAQPGAASLTLIKQVSGGQAQTTDWTLRAAGLTPIQGAGGVGPANVLPGLYTLSESAGPNGYTAGEWVCTGGTQVGPDSVSIGESEIVVCTIINTFVPPPPAPENPITTMRYQIPQKRWFPHAYADPVILHYLDQPQSDNPNDMQLLMLAGDVVLKSGGNTDDGEDIVSIVQLPSSDGGDQRGQKLYVDSIVDADRGAAGSETLAVSLLFNNQVVVGPTYTMTPGVDREQFIQNISSLLELDLYRNLGPRFAWTGGPDGPRVYAYEAAGYVQPYLSKFFVTQFITLAFTGWKHSRRTYPALISNAEVIFTIKTQDGRSYVTNVPSTGGQFKVLPIMGPQNCKDLSFAFQVDGQGSTFALFLDDWTVEFKEWQQPEYIRLAVFKT